jgi:hypothetical protein
MKLAIMKSFLLLFTGGNVAAITLFPFGIFFKQQSYLDNPRIQNHEKIHWMQQIEMFIAGVIISVLTTITLTICGIFSWWMLALVLFPLLFFYIWYVIEWFIKVILPPKGAYYDLAAEREAYEFDDNLHYLDTRKHFTWLKYIFKAP